MNEQILDRVIESESIFFLYVTRQISLNEVYKHFSCRDIDRKLILTYLCDYLETVGRLCGQRKPTLAETDRLVTVSEKLVTELHAKLQEEDSYI